MRPPVALSEQKGLFEVVLISTEAGKMSVPGDLKFAVRDETIAAPQRCQVTIEMDVQ